MQQLISQRNLFSDAQGGWGRTCKFCLQVAAGGRGCGGGKKGLCQVAIDAMRFPKI
jgi:hypothetical protein